MTKEYRYYHSETSTDTRAWHIISDHPLTIGEVEELASETGFEEGDRHHTIEAKSCGDFDDVAEVSVCYQGIDYGDDSILETTDVSDENNPKIMEEDDA